MATLEKQILTIREFADQLIILKSDAGKDHYEESCIFEQEFQAMVCELFDITHRQDVKSQSRGSNLPTAGNIQTGLQLPVLALKPDRL